jgi:hypothetical protein
MACCGAADQVDRTPGGSQSPFNDAEPVLGVAAQEIDIRAAAWLQVRPPRWVLAAKSFSQTHWQRLHPGQGRLKAMLASTPVVAVEKGGGSESRLSHEAVRLCAREWLRELDWLRLLGGMVVVNPAGQPHASPRGCDLEDESSSAMPREVALPVGSGEIVIGLSPRGQPLDPCCPLAKEGGKIGGGSAASAS